MQAPSLGGEQWLDQPPGGCAMRVGHGAGEQLAGHLWVELSELGPSAELLCDGAVLSAHLDF
jgi:hypothetical protein